MIVEKRPSIFAISKIAREKTEPVLEILRQKYPDIRGTIEHHNRKDFKFSFYSVKLLTPYLLKIQHVHFDYAAPVEEIVCLVENRIDQILLENL